MTTIFGDIFESIGKSLSHTITEDEVELGDHLYVYRLLGAFSHHGIYCGEWKDLRSSILNKINDLNNKQSLEFFQRFKELNSIFIDKENDKEEKSSNMVLSQSTSINSQSQSISDILDAVKNKQKYLFSVCDTFKPSDGIVIHLSGTAETGPLVQPSTLKSFVNDGVGSFKLINILKKVKYNCNYLEFKIKRSGSCSTQKILTNRNITIERAISAIGWDEYSIRYFNCESFCVYCKIQQPISYQVETIHTVNNIINGSICFTKKVIKLLSNEETKDNQDESVIDDVPNQTIH